MTWSTLVEEARKETLLAPSREGFGAGTSDGRWGARWRKLIGFDGDKLEQAPQMGAEYDYFEVNKMEQG